MSENTTCPTCGREDFKNEMGVKRHHSIAHDESIAGFEYNCEVCGESVTRKTERGYDKTFCSGECQGEWQSENWSGEDSPSFKDAEVEVSCEECGEIFYVAKNNRDSRFCSRTCFADWRSENWTGENNPAWKESKNDRKEGFTKYERWQIYERDDYTCQECNGKGSRLNAHHIVPVHKNKDRVHEIDNGKTLCVECHAEKHPEIEELILAQKD